MWGPGESRGGRYFRSQKMPDFFDRLFLDYHAARQQLEFFGKTMASEILQIVALLTSAFLFGGMLLFSASFAGFLFKVLPVPEARFLIRKAFPPFYSFVIISSVFAALLSVSINKTSAVILLLIALTTIPTRKILMPAINAAADSERKQRFIFFPSLSVLITLIHIAAAAVVVIILAS